MSFIEVFNPLLTLAEHSGLHILARSLFIILYDMNLLISGGLINCYRAVHSLRNIAKGTTDSRY